jgi:LytS/YehU family sensor histidine kinase
LKIISKNINQFVLIYSTFWIILSAVYAVFLSQTGVLWSSAITDSLFSFLILLVFALVINNIIKYFQPGAKNIKNIFIWCFFLTFMWFAITQLIVPLLIKNDALFDSIFYNTSPFRFLLAFLILSINSLIIWMYRIFENQKKENNRLLQMQQMAKDSELHSLRQQLQPHFLFNSLNSISSLAGSQPHKAREMIQQLSDFLRGTLQKNSDKLIPFSKEIEHLKLYLDIEKVRFGHRLNFDIQIDDNTIEFLVPPLILQPVLENAIKFGLYDTLDNVTISIESHHKQNELEIIVKNPFDPNTSNPNKGTGFGLSSLNRRLYLLYNRHQLVNFTTENNIFITQITVPKNENNSN